MKRIKEFFQNLKVGSKLTLGIVSIVFLLMSITLTIVINSYRNNLVSNSKKIMRAELDLIAEKIDSELGSMGAIAEALASAQESGFFGNREKTVDMMVDYMNRYPEIQGSYINLEPNADGLDKQYVNDTVNCRKGRFLPYANWIDPLKKDKMRIRPTVDGIFNDEWYTGPIQSSRKLSATGSRKDLNMVTITEPYYTKEEEPITSITTPIIINGKFKGAAGVDKSLVAYSKEIAKMKPYESANAFLVSRAKNLIASGVRGKKYVGKPITKLPGYTEEFFSIFKEKTGGIKKVYRPRDKSYAYYVYAVSELTGWVIGMSVLEDEVLNPINTIIWQITLGAALALIISVGFVLFFSNLIVVKPVTNIMELFGEIGMGNFQARANITSHDELGVMAESLNAMLDNTLALIQSREERDSMEQSVMTLLEEITEFTDGDLTARAIVTEDMTGAIADSFNLMAEQIGQLVRDVLTAAGRVTTTSGEVHESTEKLAESSTIQATQIMQAVQAINDMAATIRNVADSAVMSAKVSEESTVNAKEGAEAVNKTNESMTAIRENVQETARAIKRLGESSQEIGNIVQIISDIADRTSILALNASIQAAMAGEAGRGFAVVAEEVQRLAERSTNSAQQIDTLVRTIQGEITDAGASMDESIQRVVEGAKLADNAHTKLEEIQKVSGYLAELINSIASSSEEQAKESEKTSETMEKIGEISSNTSQASLETASKMNELDETASKLMDSIAAFKIEEK